MLDLIIQIKVQILTKNLILKYLPIYCMICMILQYNMIHMIYTLYRTIHEYLQYTGTIWNFLHMIRYVSFDTENYANWFVPDAALTWVQIFTEEGDSTHDWAYELTKLKILTKILNKKENKALKIEIEHSYTQLKYSYITL